MAASSFVFALPLPPPLPEIPEILLIRGGGGGVPSPLRVPPPQTGPPKKTLARPREDAQELPRRPQGAARAQEPADGHRRARDEGFAQDGQKPLLARVRGGFPLTPPNLLHHRAQRRLPERQEQQQVHQKVPKLLGHQRTQGARSRQVLLSARRALQRAGNDQVNSHQNHEVGQKLKREPAQRAPTASPVHPPIPPPRVQRRVQAPSDVVE